MSETTDIIMCVISFLGLLPIYFPSIPAYLQRYIKIYNSIDEDNKEWILKQEKNKQDLNEKNLVKILNIKELLKEVFLDLDCDNSFKQKLLNEELKKIIYEKNYKFIYPKLSIQDLENLKLLGDSWIKITNWIIDKKTWHGNIIFLPTFSLLDSNNICIKEAEDKNLYFSFYHKLCYTESKENLISIYLKIKDSILNLINLNLLIGNFDDKLGNIPIKEFQFIPHDLSLTKKGLEIYKSIKNI